MRRVFAAVAVLIMMITLFCVSAAAGAGQLSLAYVPPAEHGTLFSVDVSYDGTLSAALLELRFDSRLIAYRSAEAVADTTGVKAQADGGTLRIVLCDSDRVGGRLCRLNFKAIADGNAAFTLRMIEGVDGDLHSVDPPTACTLNVTVGVGGASNDGSADSRRGNSYGGTGSTKSGKTVDDPASATDDEHPNRGVIDLRTDRKDDSMLIILGVALGTAAFLLVIFGFIIGRRSRRKKTSAEDNSGIENNSNEE